MNHDRFPPGRRPAAPPPERMDAEAALRELLFLAVRAGGRRLTALATELIARAGDPAVGPLVRAAADPRNRPPHRARLLAVVRRVGRTSGPADRTAVTTLTADRDPRVRITAPVPVKGVPLDRRFGHCVRLRSGVVRGADSVSSGNPPRSCSTIC